MSKAAKLPIAVAKTQEARKSKVKRLEALRSDPEGTGADTFLCAEGERVLVHAPLLFPYPFFKACFGKDAVFTEARKREVDFGDLMAKSLRYLADYFYDVDLPKNLDVCILQDIWKFAAVHGIDDLNASCADLAVQNAAPDNDIQLFTLSRELSPGSSEIALSRIVFNRLCNIGTPYDVFEELSPLNAEEMESLKNGVSQAGHYPGPWFSMVLLWSCRNSEVTRETTDAHCAHMVRYVNLELLNTGDLVRIAQSWRAMKSRSYEASPYLVSALLDAMTSGVELFAKENFRWCKLCSKAKGNPSQACCSCSPFANLMYKY